MSRTSLVRRLASLQQLLAAALIVAFAGSSIWISARTLERQESLRLRSAASHLAASLEREWREEGDLRRAATAATEEDAPAVVQFDVYDAKGRLVFTTAPSGRASGAGRPSARAAIQDGGWVVASISPEPRRRAISALATALAITAIPLFLGVTALSRSLAGRALHPLSRMAAEANEAARAGELRRLERPDDPLEVAALAATFDRLFARLDDSLRAERHFAEDAAHELRTPLTVLSGELEYALQDETLTGAQREGIRRSWEQSRALTDLVEALLLLRRADSLGAENGGAALPVNLADTVRETARALLERSPERAADVCVTAGDEALVAGHATLLASAVRNLLLNALKFTRAGEPVRVSVRAEGRECAVVVEDGGPGIPAEERDRVFDPFFRGGEARSSQDGFGLGLAILRRVARSHGGDVRVSESILGGARLELKLPAWEPRA